MAFTVKYSRLRARAKKKLINPKLYCVWKMPIVIEANGIVRLVFDSGLPVFVVSAGHYNPLPANCIARPSELNVCEA